MYSKRELNENIASVKTVKSLAEVYQEISAISITQVRYSVARTRKFLEGVSQVYSHAKQSYVRKVQILIGKKKGLENLDFIRRNGKEIKVLVSANQNLYGNLIFRVFQEFIKDLKKSGEDALVIGKVGKNLVEKENLGSRVQYFELSDYKPEWTRIEDMTNVIGRYEKITIYYGEFVSVASQIPNKSDISGGVSLSTQVGEVRDYIFEPTTEQVMEFFEKQVVANIFHQKIYEAQLARFAARLLLMNQATDKAKKELDNLNTAHLKFTKYVSNKKQLTTVSGRSLWGSRYG